MLVTGTGPIGCAPAELAQHSRNGECYGELLEAANLFNPQLAQLLSQLNSEIGADVFISANAFAMNMDFVSDPQAYGILNISVTYICLITVISKIDFFFNFIKQLRYVIVNKF